MPFVVDVEVKFLAVELDGAVLEPRLAQFLGQGVELHELAGMLAGIPPGPRCGRRQARPVLHTVLLEYGLHLFVGKSAVASYDGMHDSRSLDVGIVVHVEDNAERQLVFVGRSEQM